MNIHKMLDATKSGKSRPLRLTDPSELFVSELFVFFKLCPCVG